MSKNNGEAFQPHDAATLHQATQAVIAGLADRYPEDRRDPEVAAMAVLAVARTGYARDPGRAIHADDLAEAAIARVRASSR